MKSSLCFYKRVLTSVAALACLSAHAQTLISISVTPANTNISISSNVQFTAVGTYNDSSTNLLTSGGNSWTTGASLSVATYGLGGAFASGKLYAISGFSNQRVAAYDPTNNTWANVASLPQFLQYFGSTVVSGKIYVVGGDTGGGGPVATLYRYDPALNSWAALAPMPGGSRYALSAVTVSNKIYVIGGAAVAVSPNRAVNPVEDLVVHVSVDGSYISTVFKIVPLVDCPPKT